MALEDLLRRPNDIDPISAARRDTNLTLLGKALTVGELLRLLGALDPAMPVLLPVGEGGLAAALRAETRHVELAVNRLEGFGPHDLAASADEAAANCRYWNPSSVRGSPQVVASSASTCASAAASDAPCSGRTWRASPSVPPMRARSSANGMWPRQAMSR